MITTVAGNGLLHSTDASVALGTSLDLPSGLVLDNVGNLFITDTGNGRVLKVAPDGTVTQVARSCCGFAGDGGPDTDALLNWPKDIALDPSGNLYIADTVNGRIRKVTPMGIISTVPGTDSLPSPTGVTVDSNGNLYIAAGAQVHKVTPNGIVSTVAGTFVHGHTDDGGAASAQLISPMQVKLDSAGNLSTLATEPACEW